MTQPFTPTSQIPIILLDVDGVLNACHSARQIEQAHRDAGSGLRGFQSARASIWEDGDPRTYNILFCPEVGERLEALHRLGLAEVRWLTTWGHDAPSSIAPLLGLPRDLAVQAAPPHRDPTTHTNTQEVTTTVLTFGPSGEVYEFEEWWKLAAVKKVLAENPDRPVIWVDDDLRFDRAAVDLVNATDLLIPVVPETHLGLTTQNLDLIERICTRIAEMHERLSVEEAS